MANYGFTSVPANYVNQYSTLQQDHLEKLREEIIGNRDDVSTKNRKLSAETNKRRRELANKKKSRETEEERRRLEILAERKARIQDVTYRYQRGGAAKPAPNPSPRTRQTRNRRAFSAPVMRPHQINIDDALRTIRGSTQQYNVGDSGAVFLQKYGAHLQSANHAGKDSDDGTNKHSQSVKEPTDYSSSMFEQQLAQHQATLKKSNLDTAHVFNERLMQEMRSASNPVASGAETAKNEDTQSVESLDSLDSEQPSFRSHIISSGYQQTVKNHNNNNTTLHTSDSTVGGGTYRQESPAVLVNDVHNSTANTSQLQSAAKTPLKTASTVIADTNAFLGFQVVNNDSRSRRGMPAEVPVRGSTQQPTQMMPSDINSHPRPPTEKPLNNKNSDQTDTVSFYLKSRAESQMTADFPAHAWSLSNISDSVYPPSETTPTSLNYTNSDLLSLAEHSQFINNDTFSESASDSGGPRSILKKRRDSKSATLPRSHSSPNIRDSLEVTKQHRKSSKVETPQSAKKSVRFSASQSEPVIFQKGSSPSSIPRPVQNKPKNNVPYISSAITPNVSDKAIPCKAAAASPKGPVIANHSIAFLPGTRVDELLSNKETIGEADEPVVNNLQALAYIKYQLKLKGAGPPSEVDRHLVPRTLDRQPSGPIRKTRAADSKGEGTGKPDILDIQLDRTPTDAEIDILWDKVRDCLLESPSSSRSAPADIQHLTAAVDSSLPPRQPIQKITASNINHIGRAQSAGPRRKTGNESGLQRPKQDQKSFIQNNEGNRSQYNSGTIAPQSSPRQLANGAATSNSLQNGPTHSSMEPNLSTMVNNTPQDVSESMMAYLTAEQLAGHESLTDQDILKAMSDAEYRQQLGSNGRPVVPISALSMEEHRILQSLDRLNNKLKVVEDGPHSHRSNQSDHQHPVTPSSVSSMLYNGHNDFTNALTSEKVQLKPHPPYTGATSQRSFSATSRGFRGHKPLHPRQRTTSADMVRQHNLTSAQVNGTNRQFRLY